MKLRTLLARASTVLPLVFVAAVACSKSGETPAPASSTAPSTGGVATPATPVTSASASPTFSNPASATGTTAGHPTDLVPTSRGDLRITPLHHATLLFTWQGQNIFMDPFHEANFAGLPKADVVLITHSHPDHFDLAALDLIKQPSTIIVAPADVASKLPKEFTHVVVMKNGETRTVDTVGVEAVPMYNLVRGPSAGTLFHPKGLGNGYVLTFGDKRVYLSGDTECTDEMRALRNIDVAFVCMNLPYTMPPPEAAACVKAFRPRVVYPYHYRGSNLADFTGPLVGERDIEVRERNWY